MERAEALASLVSTARSYQFRRSWTLAVRRSGQAPRAVPASV